MRVQPIRDLDKFLLMQKLLFDDKKYQELLLLRFLFNTNLRVGDALKLRWRDVLDENDFPKKDFYLEETKTRKEKWIPMTDQLASSLMTFYVQLKPHKSWFIFRSKSNHSKNRLKAWRREYVHKFIKEYAHRAGVTENIGSHTPRKTWGYHAYQNGIDIYEISRIMNHSSPRVTEIYCGIDDDKVRETFNFVSQLTSGVDSILEEVVLTPPKKKRNTPKRYRKNIKKMD